MQPTFDSSVYKNESGFPFLVHFEDELTKTGETNDGIPQYKSEEIVILIKGNYKQPVKIAEYKVRHAADWLKYVEPLYLQWKAAKEVQTDGMPLSHAPCMEKVNVLQFAAAGIHTVEQLIAAKDEVIQIVPDGFKLRDAIKRFVEASKGTQEISALLKDKERLEKRVKFLEEKLEQLQDNIKESKK